MGILDEGEGGRSLLRFESRWIATDGGRYSSQKVSTALILLVDDARLSPPALVSTPLPVCLPCLGTALRGMTSTRCTKPLISFAANSSALSGERKRDRARRGEAIRRRGLGLSLQRVCQASKLLLEVINHRRQLPVNFFYVGRPPAKPYTRLNASGEFEARTWQRW